MTYYCLFMNEAVEVSSLQELSTAERCEGVTHEVHQSEKTPTIMMSKRSKPETPHMARRRSFCQKETERGVRQHILLNQ